MAIGSCFGIAYRSRRGQKVQLRAGKNSKNGLDQLTPKETCSHRLVGQILSLLF